MWKCTHHRTTHDQSCHTSHTDHTSHTGHRGYINHTSHTHLGTPYVRAPSCFATLATCPLPISHMRPKTCHTSHTPTRALLSPDTLPLRASRQRLATNPSSCCSASGGHTSRVGLTLTPHSSSSGASGVGHLLSCPVDRDLLSANMMAVGVAA
jgi:hypothetical protein